jgi:lysophospholipase L1-like esterase
MKEQVTRLPDTRQARRRILFSTILIFVALSPLLILEVYVRGTRQSVDLWVETGRKAGRSPQAEWAFIDAFSAYSGRPGKYSGVNTSKTVNSHGFISTPEVKVDKPSETVRIVFLGESSTAGTGRNLSDVDTWPWQAVETIKKRYRDEKIDFINGALGGYTSFESYGRLWSRIRFFSPDIIIVNHGWNEMYYFDEVEKITSWRTVQGDDWTFDRVVFEAYKPLLLDYLIRPFQSFSRLRLRLSTSSEGEVGRSKPLASDYDRRGLEIWRTNLGLLREAAKLIEAELFVAKQATLVVPSLPLKERTRIRYDYHGFDHDAHVNAFHEIYRVIEEEIPPNRIIDLTSVSGHPEYFYDQVHPTKEGASRIATIVSDVIAAFLLSKSTANQD